MEQDREEFERELFKELGWSERDAFKAFFISEFSVKAIKELWKAFVESRLQLRTTQQRAAELEGNEKLYQGQIEIKELAIQNVVERYAQALVWMAECPFDKLRNEVPPQSLDNTLIDAKEFLAQNEGVKQ